MKLGAAILKTINKAYPPEEVINLRWGRYDLVLRTDKNGLAVQAFLGRMQENGSVRGDRYARTLKYNRDGALIKDQWERKGPAY